jgi:hypothetical protein
MLGAAIPVPEANRLELCATSRDTLTDPTKKGRCLERVRAAAGVPYILMMREMKQRGCRKFKFKPFEKSDMSRCGHPIPAPVSGKKIRKVTPFRFPDRHTVPSNTAIPC